MLISTTFDLAGYDVTANLGEVFGLTVRSRNIGAGCIAGLRSIGGGEIPEFTKLLVQSRNEAMARMVTEAANRGANAVVGIDIDYETVGAQGGMMMVSVCGTAVVVS